VRKTGLGALPLWFEQGETARALVTPGQLHLGFFSVGGEKNFTPVLALLVALGIPWAIVCDGGPFRADTGRGHIFRQVLKVDFRTSDASRRGTRSGPGGQRVRHRSSPSTTSSVKLWSSLTSSRSRLALSKSGR